MIKWQEIYPENAELSFQLQKIWAFPEHETQYKILQKINYITGQEQKNEVLLNSFIKKQSSVQINQQSYGFQVCDINKIGKSTLLAIAAVDIVYKYMEEQQIEEEADLELLIDCSENEFIYVSFLISDNYQELLEIMQRIVPEEKWKVFEKLVLVQNLEFIRELQVRESDLFEKCLFIGIDDLEIVAMNNPFFLQFVGDFYSDFLRHELQITFLYTGRYISGNLKYDLNRILSKISIHKKEFGFKSIVPNFTYYSYYQLEKIKDMQNILIQNLREFLSYSSEYNYMIKIIFGDDPFNKKTQADFIKQFKTTLSIELIPVFRQLDIQITQQQQEIYLKIVKTGGGSSIFQSQMLNFPSFQNDKEDVNYLRSLIKVPSLIINLTKSIDLFNMGAKDDNYMLKVTKENEIQLTKSQNNIGQNLNNSESKIEQKINNIKEISQQDKYNLIQKWEQNQNNPESKDKIKQYFQIVFGLPWDKYVSMDELNLQETKKILDKEHYGMKKTKEFIIEYLGQFKQVKFEEEQQQKQKSINGPLNNNNNTSQSSQNINLDEYFKDIPYTQGKTFSGQDLEEINPENQQENFQQNMNLQQTQEINGIQISQEFPKLENNLKVPQTRKGPYKNVLCLVGPPGVGKTSIVKVISKCFKRDYLKIAMGGVTDSSFILGHSSVYQGSKPGEIVFQLLKSKSMNPIFLLDEIDKVQSGAYQDPKAQQVLNSLLELLDPSQNSQFRDHYLDLTLDLSHAFFICTANYKENIPGPLLDRMVVIECEPYKKSEKVVIAQQYVIPKILEMNNITAKQLEFNEDDLSYMIQNYQPSESGIRKLEEMIETIARKTSLELVEAREKNQQFEKRIVDIEYIKKIFGQPQKQFNVKYLIRKCGSALGLIANQKNGGQVSMVETVFYKGKGKLICKEEIKNMAEISLGWIKCNIDFLENFKGVQENQKLKQQLQNLMEDQLNINVNFTPFELPLENKGISGSLSLLISMISALTGKKVQSNICFVGEITLQGIIMGVTSLKQMIIEAIDRGIQMIVLSIQNENNVIKYLTNEQRAKIKFEYVEYVEDLFDKFQQVIFVQENDQEPSIGRSQSHQVQKVLNLFQN
ncbi:Ribosomal protein S5 domain 2-type fold [Pseudocohnilembus persalinus]|uniref:Ribosomal protein S5 domain 2-type fold n=1 Tax=Pseudocohnilembus persalinus TaxID=266149 RepID=A0A0V0QZL6_PSEPJ|nr:Ribosomal protein S5 domain 2-type fold [Pseudocohnilembus persalinus]|eukprot:KRX07694.1 Ribosomal protein S5 domain 2-type fold [Pseudocohnilembus persalinus]